MTQFAQPNPSAPPAAITDEFVEVSARCFRVQTSPVTPNQALAARNDREHYETVIGVPVHAPETDKVAIGPPDGGLADVDRVSDTYC
jgi:hypothetical protein